LHSIANYLVFRDILYYVTKDSIEKEPSMKNFLKYLILMVADLLAVGIVAGTVIRTIVYGIVGEENHHNHLFYN